MLHFSRKFPGMLLGLALASLCCGPRSQALAQTPPAESEAPFQLTADEHARLVAILEAWEARNARVARIAGTFAQWGYDDVFKQPSRETGTLRYQAPDLTLIEVAARDGQPAQKWICNGKTLFDFDAEMHVLAQIELSAGAASPDIAFDPPTLLFTCTKDQLLEKFWMREVTPPDKMATEIWIEAVPRIAKEPPELDSACIVLRRADMLPSRLMTDIPGRRRSVCEFNWFTGPAATLNIFPRDHFDTSPPEGWTKVAFRMQDVSSFARNFWSALLEQWLYELLSVGVLSVGQIDLGRLLGRR